MIGRIRGKLVEKLPPEVLIDVSGVGYEIQMPMTSLYQLPELGAEVIVYTHFVVREDAQLLFGFADRQERALFRELIKANGVGPKMALTIMSGMTAAQFAQVVNQGDVSSLVKLPGVGKKTAERLLVEMKDRLKTVFGDVDAMTITPVDIGEVAVASTAGSARDEAMSALLALGYKPPQAEKMLKTVFNDAASAEELIRDALKSVA
ncbi:Holliday junction branch migration protein RuvA [Planctobacterium marinum]|uniref:Holliday junction branch migration protein RuvA n=1 Tax=Planctobacterium marinum TaxID=1631968 RepID=UPI001E44AFEC|nr:Holliday junction branch migration protein RuvA [Planctobacterium marinum]MCC2605593.1 Holliday junction branch migration protein RuvA [Planctobacterium marinum]